MPRVIHGRTHHVQLLSLHALGYYLPGVVIRRYYVIPPEWSATVVALRRGYPEQVYP